MLGFEAVSPFAGVLAAVVGYLAGSIPFGLLLTKAAGLGDIRAIGSGNIGATNVLRTGNKALAAADLVLDAVEGGGGAAACALALGRGCGAGRGCRGDGGARFPRLARLQRRQGRGDGGGRAA